MIHLNHAGVAPICGAAARALEAYAAESTSRAYTQTGWYRKVNELRGMLASLIGARGGHEIAMMPNTSTGLATVARGLDWRRGDSVVITDVEYPANRYPWEDLQRFGVKLIEVKQGRDGRVAAEDVCAAVEDRTRVVAISHVQYASGYRIDLVPIAETVHRAGGYLCVDGIQSVGMLPVDVRAMGVDFLAADGHKWLLGPEGAGFLYVKEDLCEVLHPPVVGWLNMVNAEDYGRYEYRFQKDARRFEPGSYNIPGLLALRGAVGMLMEVGIEEVWRRVEALTGFAETGLRERGFRVFSPRRLAGERSGIVMFEPKEGQEAGKVVRGLAERGMHLAVRSGRLRMSPHFYNTEGQIEAVLGALAEA